MWRARKYFGLAFLCCCALITLQLQRPITDALPLGEAPASSHPRQKARPAGSPQLSLPPLAVRPRRAQPPPPPPTLLQELPTLAARDLVAGVGEEEQEGELEPPTVEDLPEEHAAQPTLASAADRSWCLKATQEHGVVAHQTWGSLPDASQGTWTKLGCDKALAPALARKPAQRPALERNPAAGADAEAAGGGSGDGARRCTEMREAHHVLPGKCWARTPSPSLGTSPSLGPSPSPSLSLEP